MTPPYQPQIRAATIKDAPEIAILAERTFVETFIDGFGIPYPPDDLAAFKADVFAEDITRERLADADVVLSVGSVGDSYDNALAETINGLYKAELIHRRGPWRSL